MTRTALALLLAVTANAHAACRAVEYSELKDTPSPRLAELYCQHVQGEQREVRQLAIAHNLASDFRKMGVISGARDAQRDVEAAEAALKLCQDEQAKVRNALANRSEPAPTCEKK